LVKALDQGFTLDELTKFTDLGFKPSHLDAIGIKTSEDLDKYLQISKAWGTLADGTNQGVKHFNYYWELYPERIPSLAKRLGVDPNDFANTVQGFENFTNSAKNVIANYT
jgi:hypothetical protein